MERSYTLAKLFVGEKIKIFPDTNILQYGRWIHTQGFNYEKRGSYIVIINKTSPEYDKKLFATILKHRRKLKGISKEMLAEKIEVTKTTVSVWENGTMMPSKYNLNKIMPVLDITERDLERCQI